MLDLQYRQKTENREQNIGFIFFTKTNNSKPKTQQFKTQNYLKMNPSLSEVHSSVETQNGQKTGIRRWLAFLGPAYLVSVGYMDPGNWATDIAGGSAFGYQLLWVLLLSNLLAIVLQSLAVRLGIVQGLDLAQASRKYYPRHINIPLYILAEIAIAACDLAEVIGMAIGLNLLFGLPIFWGVCITVLDSFVLLFLINKGIRTMEAFIGSLVFIIGASFLVEMLIVQPAASDVLTGLIPTGLSKEALYIAIGIIGATVMPHNLYLHSSLVQTRKLERTPTGIKQAIKYNFWDTALALNIAFLVNASILCLSAAAFFKNGIFNVAEIQDAHTLLNNIFGSLAPALFAIALIAAGQSSTITGTLAGQIIMEGYLNLRLRPWLRRLLTRMIAVVPALLTVVILGEKAMGSLLILSQVILSLQLGYAVVPLIHFTSNKKNMGAFANKLWLQAVAWIGAGIIIILNIQLVITKCSEWVSATDQKWIALPMIALGGYLLYILGYTLITPWLSAKNNNVQLPHKKALPLVITPIQAFKHIAVAIDFSEADNRAILYAVSQGGTAAKYTLIHIVETAGAQYLGNMIQDYETLNDNKNLQAYATYMNGLGYNTTTAIDYGNPAKGIVKVVKEQQADLVVMVKHGHKGIKDILLGATIDTVRHGVDVPVLVV